MVATTEGTLLTPLLANDPAGAASNPLLLGTAVAAVAGGCSYAANISSLNIGLPLVIVDVVATSVFCFCSVLVVVAAAFPLFAVALLPAKSKPGAVAPLSALNSPKLSPLFKTGVGNPLDSPFLNN